MKDGIAKNRFSRVLRSRWSRPNFVFPRCLSAGIQIGQLDPDLQLQIEENIGKTVIIVTITTTTFYNPVLGFSGAVSQ